MASIDYARARRALMRRDPVIATLIRRHGECGLASSQRTDPFHALLHAIIAQQLSTKAARTIEGRFSALFDGNPTPAAVADVSRRAAPGRRAQPAEAQVHARSVRADSRRVAGSRDARVD